MADNDASSFYGGNTDIWVLEVDGSTGSIVWERNYGSTGRDFAGKSYLNDNDELLLVAEVDSSDNDVSSVYGNDDIWVAKLDNSGNIMWERSYGGDLVEGAGMITQAKDGNYIVAGSSWSSNADVGGNFGQTDEWMFKIDPSGNLLWESNFGGGDDDEGMFLAAIDTGEYIMVGESYSSSDQVSDNYGSTAREDMWVTRITTDNLSSISEKEDLGRKIELLPNPAKDEVKISASFKRSGTYHLAIRDMNGRRILQERNFSFGSRIDVSEMSRGLHFLEIVEERSGRRAVKKLMLR